MIKNVESFQAELQHFDFSDRHAFVKSDVEVVQPLLSRELVRFFIAVSQTQMGAALITQ